MTVHVLQVYQWDGGMDGRQGGSVTFTVIDHCAMGWGLRPQCGYSDGTIMPSKEADLLINREYYRHDPDNLDAWPEDRGKTEDQGETMNEQQKEIEQ